MSYIFVRADMLSWYLLKFFMLKRSRYLKLIQIKIIPITEVERSSFVKI